VDTSKTITHVGLCAGYGGIELGLSRAIPDLRSVALCEIEAFACANLVAKMEAGLMDCAPIWTDLKTFPWEEFRGRVVILTSGYPCQPFSAAGKRAGSDDPRHLWPFIADGIRLMRPKICFFENVEGHITLGLSSVISDLEELGYKVSWGIFSAREVGAPHQRKRVFIMAYDAHGEQRAWSLLRQNWQGATLLERCGSGPAEELADTDSARGWEDRESAESWPSRPSQPQHGWEPPRVVANNSDNGRSNRRIARIMGCESNTEKGTRNQFASTITYSGETGAEVVGNSKRIRLEPTRDEGTMEEESRKSKTEGCKSSSATQEPSDSKCFVSETQPTLGRDVDGTTRGLDYAELCVTCDNRTDELRLLGNGVVPATAERAFRTLLAELLT